MKKIILSLIILLIILLSSLLIWYRYTDKEPIRCNSNIYAEIKSHNENKIKFNLNLNLFTINTGSSELLLSGSVHTTNEQYIVARRLFFSSKPSDFKGFYNMKLIREERNRKDNMPDSLWQNLLPEIQGKEFYAGIKRLSDRALLIQKLSTPYFICAIAKK